MFSRAVLITRTLLFGQEFCIMNETSRYNVKTYSQTKTITYGYARKAYARQNKLYSFSS